MKIAFIGQKGIPAHSGGVEKHVENLTTRLALLGHEVTVYVRPHYTSSALSDWNGVRLVHLPSIHTKHLDAISHTFLATLHALFQEYDVIHYQAIGPSVWSFLPRIFRPRTLVIATFHSRDYFHQKWGTLARAFLHFSEWVACHVPKETIVISETLLAYAKQWYDREFIFIPNGAEIHPTNSEQIVRSLGLKPKRYILCVSRLVRHKGVHYLIKAFQLLKETGELPNQCKLAIVGKHAETEDYESYLKFIANGDPDILFLGERTGDDISELYTHALTFVQPSEDEGLSLALLEAMGYGIPCVVSDIPANIEAIENTGVTFETKNVVDLKRKLSALINRPEELTRLGHLARERALTHYDWMAIARKTSECYERLIREQREKVLVSPLPETSKR